MLPRTSFLLMASNKLVLAQSSQKKTFRSWALQWMCTCTKWSESSEIVSDIKICWSFNKFHTRGHLCLICPSVISSGRHESNPNIPWLVENNVILDLIKIPSHLWVYIIYCNSDAWHSICHMYVLVTRNSITRHKKHSISVIITGEFNMGLQ